MIGDTRRQLLERRPRGANAEMGEKRLWASGLWEKQPDDTWKLVPGYRKLMRAIAVTGKYPDGEKVPARDLRSLRARLKKQKGRPGCPKGKWPNPETQKCLKVRKITRGVARMLNRLDSLRNLPGTPTSKLVRATKEFKEWQDWYERSGAILEKMSGMHKDMIIGIFAATSSATETAANATQAFKALRIIATTPPGVKPNFNLPRGEGFMGKHIENIERVLAGGAPKGPKVGPFTRALRGDPEAVPIDRHIGFVLYGREPKDAEDHRIAKAVLRKVGKKLGISGRDVQAALWALSITASGNQPVSYDQIITAREEEYNQLIKALDKLRWEETMFHDKPWEESRDSPAANLTESLSAAALRNQIQDKYPGVKLWITDPRDDKVAKLDQIVVPKKLRGQNVGTEIMRQILSWADRNGITLALTPSSDFGGSVPRLKRFYSRHGFIMNKGRHKDYAISELMYRRPKRFVREQLEQRRIVQERKRKIRKRIKMLMRRVPGKRGPSETGFFSGTVQLQ